MKEGTVSTFEGVRYNAVAAYAFLGTFSFSACTAPRNSKEPGSGSRRKRGMKEMTKERFAFGSPKGCRGMEKESVDE